MSNQRAIAAALGVTQATVSRALRDDPSIPLETRQRISETARQLGYRPNALVSVLMKHVRAGKSIRQQGCIAVVVDAASKGDWLADPACKVQLDGIVAQAKMHGYRTECLFLRAKGMSTGRLEQTLRKKGISGVILAGASQGDFDHLDLRWDQYAVIMMGYGLDGVRLNRTGSDLAFNMNDAFDELLRRQYRRIGLCLPASAVNTQDNRRLATYLERQLNLPEQERLPVFIGSVKSDSIDGFREWYERSRPDAMICLEGDETEWLRQLGLSPLDLGLACLKRPLGSDFAGIEENDWLVGKTACDTIVNQITRNELGLPAHPLRTLIEGTWKEGATLPACNPARLAG